MADENKTNTIQEDTAIVEEVSKESKESADKMGKGLRFFKSKGVCRKCRRLGVKLFLKGEKCLSPKCPLTRRFYAPGQHGQKKTKDSDYARHLQEKQKLALIYGLKDKQLRIIVKKASQSRENTEEQIVQMLERRLDNVIFKAGWAFSLAQARKLIVGGHFYINGRKNDCPGYLVKVKDIISFSPRAEKLKLFKEIILPQTQDKQYPDWFQRTKKEIKIIRFPKLEEININIDFSLIIEFYKK